MILGVTALFCVALELTYRAQAAVRRWARGETPTARRWADPNHPNAGERWWQDLIATEHLFGGGELRYDPFRGWWPGEYHSRHVNVDSGGRRVTPQPTLDSGPRRSVFMFGGSAMWGWMVRDSGTIAALVATRLRTMGYTDVEIVNLAQSTFDLAQNAATLHQELRRGNRPAVAVFLDGNNEVAPAFQTGRVGVILNQPLIARRFERRSDLPSDLFAVLRHSALVQRLTQLPTPSMGAHRERLCGSIAMSYAAQVEMLQAVSAAFGFRSVFLWQPMRATSRKPLTQWERGVANETWVHMIRQCSASVDSAMELRPAVPYVPLHSLFDERRETVFLDDFGHMTENGNRMVADRIAALIAERLAPPAGQRAPTPPRSE